MTARNPRIEQQPGLNFQPEKADPDKEETVSSTKRVEQARSALPEAEFDDNPHAERRALRNQYDVNLAKQRANLDNEASAPPKPVRKMVGRPERFTKPEGLELRRAAGAAVDKFRQKQFDRFYRSMSYDEKTAYILKPLDERDRLFDEWLEEQRKK